MLVYQRIHPETTGPNFTVQAGDGDIPGGVPSEVPELSGVEKFPCFFLFFVFTSGYLT